MSTATAKRPYVQALADAEAFRDLFPASCYERWEIAGSVRRRRDEVGDVEHVVIAKRGIDPSRGLFGEEISLLWHHLDAMVAGRQVSKHLYVSHRQDGGESVAPRWGERYRGVDFRGFNHEIFTADVDNWGAQLAMRTGPAGFSHMLVSKLQFNGYMNDGGYVWDKRRVRCDCGWQGDDAELTWAANTGAKGIIKDPDGRDGGPFLAFCPNCRRSEGIGMLRVPAPTEQEYFRLCNVPWAEPHQRTEPQTGRFR